MSFVEVMYFIIPAAIFYAAPLIYTGLGTVFSERAGVVNIGAEGLMIIGAFSAIVFNLFTYESLSNVTPWVAILVAMLVGVVFSLFLAIPAISFRSDQTVTGVALNLLGLAVALFLTKLFFEGKGQTDYISERITKIDVPGLEHIPVLGPLFFEDVHPTSLLAIALAFVVWFVIYKTPFGLRLRAVGEHPMAADTMGVNVTKMRYMAVMLSGALAGIGGAVYAQSITNQFSHTTIAGQGFMAIAAMIFGKWHPLGMTAAALFFGLAQALTVVGNSIPYVQDVPSWILFILPYVLTILALAGFIGKQVAPKASGQPYIKGKR
jgi:general nucleoside transport system permease protein